MGMPVPDGRDLKCKDSGKHCMVSSQKPGSTEYNVAGMECKSLYSECNQARM